MIKYETIGMIESSEKNFPNIKAHENIKNWSLITVDFTNKVSSYADNTTKKADNLFLVDNTILGDLFSYNGIAKDEMLNCKSLKALDQQFLVIDNCHITYASGIGYSDIDAGTTLLGVGADGNFEIISSETGYSIYFKVTEKTHLNEHAVKAQIIVA